MLNTKDREHLFLDLMSRIRNHKTYRKMQMIDKLEFIKYTSKIFQHIPENDISLISGEFLLSSLNERGRRRCAKIIKFANELEKKVVMSDPDWKINFKNKVKGINI